MEIFNRWFSALIWAFVGICFFYLVIKITLAKIRESENGQESVIRTVMSWLLIVFYWILAIFILGIAAALLFHCMIGV